MSQRALRRAMRRRNPKIRIESRHVAVCVPLMFSHDWMPEAEIHSGEDFGFADRVRAAGIQAYIDHDISKEVMHLGQIPLNPMQKKVTR